MYHSVWCKGYALTFAMATAAWWVAILSLPTVKAWFIWPGLPDSALFAFLPADIPFLIVVPLAWTVRSSPALWNVHRYATHYATLVTLGLCLGSGGAWLGGLLMIVASSGAEFVARPLRLPAAPIEAKPRTILENAVRTLAQTTVMWLVFLGLIPYSLKLAGRAIGVVELPAVNPWIPWSLFWIAGSVGIYCGLLFARYGQGTPLPLDTTTRFVVMGPYRLIRNPMATLGILQGIMVGLLLRSWPVVVYSFAGAVVWHVFARPWEEADLLARFGESYASYRGTVRNWIPSLRMYPRILVSKQMANPKCKSTTKGHRSSSSPPPSSRPSAGKRRGAG